MIIVLLIEMLNILTLKCIIIRGCNSRGGLRKVSIKDVLLSRSNHYKNQLLYNNVDCEVCPKMKFNQEYSKNFFVSSYLIEWNNLDSNIKSSACFAYLKKPVLGFARTSGSSIFHFHTPRDLKLITRLRLELSH